MGIIITILTCLVVSFVLAVLWVRGIDYMDKHYPEYKGEDLFGEDEELTKPTDKKTKVKKNR
jgi:hypothetical protein